MDSAPPPGRRLPSAPPVVRVAAVVLAVVWSAAWVFLGVRVAHEVRELTQLSETVVSVGRAAELTADTLTEFQGLPVVGDRLREPTARVREAAASAVSSGSASRKATQDLSVLLGVSIALIGSTPLLCVLVFIGVRRR